MLYFYDCEVFKEDWIFVFISVDGEVHAFHNDCEGVIQFIGSSEKPCVICGFNNKHYDKYILSAVLNYKTNEEIKHLSDQLIYVGSDTLSHDPLPVYLHQWDLKDDCQQGLSLKAIEGHLGLPIYESEVDFDIDRALTDDEIQQVTDYCIEDVKAVIKLYELRQDYIQSKIKLGEELGLIPEKAAGYTNAKLAALYLGANRTTEWTDERDYKYPDALNQAYIPYEVIKFFNQLYDKSISDEDVFSSKLDIYVGECPITMSFGGIHGAIPNYQNESTATRMICNFDVASYYPHLMVLYDYISRNVPNPKLFGDVLNRRIKAKRNKQKAIADALKLVINTTFGAMKNQYNDLYDPLQARSVCISGQLFLLELVEHLYQSIMGLRVIQVNTDGIMIEFDTTAYESVKAIVTEWQSRTGFTLEEDRVKKIIQKDVNNYIEVTLEDKIKIKGGMLVRGINTAGAFNINNNMPIVSKAMVDYFVKGIPVEDTIDQCDNPLEFQIIAKASGKYKKVMHEIHNELVDIQRCNRVYATTIDWCGTLYKVHGIRNNTVKMGGLPDHCMIDNFNKLLNKDHIDKSWYIAVAKEQIEAFIENKKSKKIKEKKPMNLYEKLASARLEFANEQVIKSGVNRHADYKYFELEDIVPIATRIFSQLKCLFMVTFSEDFAIGTLINIENSEEKIAVTIPLRHIAEPAKFRMNETQAMGAEITYMRRYLYMVLLDIIEADALEKGDGRTQLKAKLVEPADELLIKSLKTKLKELKEKDSNSTAFVQEVVVNSKAFSEISKEDCNAWITEINRRLSECTSQ